MSIRFYKDPDDVLEYGFDWSEWLPDGVTISTSAWTVPAGITKISDDKTDTITKIVLDGGTAGTSYSILNHIVASDSQEKDKVFVVAVREES